MFAHENRIKYAYNAKEQISELKHSNRASDGIINTIK